MIATIEQMFQKQLTLIKDMAQSVRDIIESCEYFHDANEELEKRMIAYEEEVSELNHRVMVLEAQNFRLRKTIWKLKNDFNCTCDGVDRHSCETHRIIAE